MRRKSSPARIVIFKMEDRKVILKGRLDGYQRNRLKGLLNMMYSPSLLASEIGFDKEQVYKVYVPLGCPKTRDNRNHLFIHGVSFRNWYLEIYKKVKMGKNESYCRTCGVYVKIVTPEEVKKGDTTFLISHCPRCNRKLAKIIANSRGKCDQS